MELEQRETAPMGIAQPNSTASFGLAAHLKVLWRSPIWTAIVHRVGRQRKTLAVRETVALGDRRFVSVIQFERQRFLIGSSPSSITLLARVPDELAGVEERGKVSGEEI